jgi:hypothetical protein
VPETLWVEETRDCADRECPGKAEPEEDGDLHYFACTTCGYESGYVRIQQSAPGCQLGVPADIRARAQVPQAGPVPISIGRRPAS